MSTIPIIGIGASAGGLKELECFFKNMPSSKDAAFVIIQHLSPNYKSILADIVTRYTEMGVSQIKDKTLVEVGKVYIIPPNKLLTLKKGKLILSEIPREQRINLPIDVFFRSLKDNLGEKAVAVILSGTGSDGTSGIKEVKEAGGLTIVQQPDTADYDGMPISAIKTGLIDFVIPVEEMPKVIIDYIGNEFKEKENLFDGDKKFNNYISQIFELIKVQTGNDFSLYKKNTIYRRIERRLTVNKLSNVKDYVQLLKSSNTEVGILNKEFSISVTNFFRDAETFEYIKKHLVSKIVSNTTDNNLRIWIPACATGEEAYSWSMLLKNYIDDNKLNIELQVFASDIDADAIEKAREGFYTNNIISDVPKDVLERYFIEEKNGYRIKKSIRETVIFAEQNFLQDPPYSRLDMISCRNFLIYLDNALQQKAISIAHYSLKREGVLVLGNSEGLGNYAQHFKVLDRKFKIFQKIDDLNNSSLAWKLNFGKKTEKASEKTISHESIPELAKEHILEKHTPPSVVIDMNGNMLFAQGRTGKYLEITTGQITTNIIKVARDGLKIPLSNAFRKAKVNNKEITYENVRVKTNGDYEYVDVSVSPLKQNQKETKLYIVLFQIPKQLNKALSGNKDIETENLTVRELEKELAEKEQYLQSTIEELETTNEELKSSNEEAQSTNEELQSTNEELETSKEELQSVNEELTTTNNELSIKVDEINKANSQLKNLLSATNIATIFLDKNLRIFNFTPAISIIINLQDSDIGRSITQFTNNLKYDKLVQDAKEVINTLDSKEIEVQNSDNSYFWMRILPYRNMDDNIEGVVITFTDITEKKKAESKLKESEEKYRTTYENSPDSIIIHDYEMNILDVNTKATEEFGYSKKEFLQKKVFDLHPKEVLVHSKKVLAEMEEQDILNVETKFQRENGSVFWADATPCKYELNGQNIIHVVIRNTTELVESKHELEKHRNHLEELVEEKTTKLVENEAILKRTESITQVGSWEWDIETDTITWSDELFKIFNVYAKKGVPGYDKHKVIYTEDSQKLLDNYVKNAIEKGEPFETELEYVKGNGETGFIQSYGFAQKNKKGKVVKLFGSVQEITKQKKDEKELIKAKVKSEESERYLDNIVNNIGDPIFVKDEQSRLLVANDAFCQIFGANKDDIIGKTLAEDVTPKERENFLKIDKQVLYDGVENVTEESLTVRGASTKTIATKKTRFIDNNGKKFLVGVIRDITDRKKAEQALLFEKERAQQYLDVATVIMLSLDSNGNVLLMNPKGCELLGYSNEEIIGMNWFESFLPAEQRKEVKEVFKKSVAGNVEPVEYYENKVLCKDGTHSKIAWHNSVLRDKDKKTIGIFSSGEDITERKKQEEELRQNAFYLKKAQEIGKIGTWELDLLKDNLIWTEENYKIFGVIPGTIMNYELFLEIVHPDDREYVNTAWTAAVRNKKPYEVEHRLLVKKQTKWVRQKADINYDSDGNPISAIGFTQDISNRKKAETLIKEEKEKFQILADNTFDWEYWNDTEGNYIYLSPSCERITGYKLEEFVKNPILLCEITIPKYKTQVKKHYKKISEAGPHSEEFIILNKNGKEIWIEHSCVPVYDENGTFKGRRGVNRDITIRKEAELKLEESYSLLSNLTSMVPGVVYQYRLYPDGRSAFPISSKGMYDIYEVTPEEVKEDASPVFTRIHPDDYDYIVETINESAEKLTVYHSEFRVILPKQGLRWRQSYAKPERLEDGSTLWHGIISDITDRKGAEKEIIEAKRKVEESEKRFQLFVNQSPSPLAVIDKNLEQVLYWSDSATQKLGHSPKTVSEWFELAYPDPDYRKVVFEQWLPKVEIASKTQKATNTGEYEITCKDGSVITGEFYVQVIPDRFIITLNDISQRKKAEKELIIAKEKAEESDRLKSAFLANMSHEIRTPMNGILGFTELLKHPELTGEEQAKFIEIIQKSGDRMLNTVNDIIEISKIETGQVTMSSINLNINKHLLTLGDFFKLEASKKGLNFSIDNKLKEDESLIITDKNKVSSILTNLIKNAIKFTENGIIEIGLKKKKELLEFCVKDTGIGIPESRKDAIFNRFEQADIEDSMAAQGSGLGLSIAKSYAEILGGKIWVESEENKGSTFFFSIPYNPIKTESKTKSSGKKQTENKVKKLNILIVEDDDTSSLFLSTILKDKARNIQIVCDGLKAVEICKNNSNFDLVLMDIKLPGIDGLEATRRIRKFDKNIKIIAQTAHALEGDNEKVKKAGCNDYISKPLNKEKLFKLLGKHF